MSLYVVRKIDFQHSDIRGDLIQLVHDGFKQINILKTNKGSTRGAHFHKKAIEAFFVYSGSVEVTFWNLEKKEVMMICQNHQLLSQPD